MQKRNMADLQKSPLAFSLMAIIGARHVKSGMDIDQKHTYTLRTTQCV
jgi:hypothetical protein